MLKWFARGVQRTSRAHPRARERARSALVPVLAISVLTVVLVARSDRRAVDPSRDSEPFTRERRSAAHRSVSEPSADSSRMMHLVVVAQRRDCDGNLSFASFFNRARLRDRVVVRQLLIEGANEDTVGLRARLPSTLRQVPMAMLRETERDALRAMGHRATPVFLLIDAEHRVLAAIPVDPDPVHRTAFLRAITHLATHDPKS